MSVSIALICEGPTDPRTVCPLADRVIVAGVDWIDADEIDTHRHYRGFGPTDEYLRWDQIDPLARQYRGRFFGHFEGLPLHGDGQNTRKALALLTLYAPAPAVEAIIIFRDGDREHAERFAAIRRVRDTVPLPIVVGVANRMRECWVLNAFVPSGRAEEDRHVAELERLGFDPLKRAHDLAETNLGEDRCAKRVLRHLTGDNPERERECICDISFDTLRQRGEHTGLSDFLAELESRLIPAFR